MIIVTGGSGKVGRAAVKHLMERGYPVTSIDMQKPPGLTNPPKPGSVNFTRVDICDFGQVMSAFSGINARVEEPVTGIVHLGAIASPGEAPDEVIFQTNVVSTYNVFEAARRLKIRNIVWASSETVYGIPYAKGPAYVPVDEAIEAPAWSYSLSKLMGEKLADHFCQWDPKTKIVGLRFSNVQDEADYERFAEYEKDPMGRRFNLWTYIDSRDAAQAIRLGLEANLKGAHVFGIANSNSISSKDNNALLAEAFPKVKKTREIKPHETLISIEKAQRVLGYKPEFDFKQPGKAAKAPAKKR